VTMVDGGVLLLLGGTGEAQPLGGSRWAAWHGARGGPLPALDVDLHRRLLALVAGLAGDGILAGVHDVAEGGLGVCLAELAVSSSLGFRVGGVAGPAELFGEAPSRVVVCVPDAGVVSARAREADVPARELGRAGGDRLVVDGLLDVDLVEAVAAWHGAIPRALAG